MGLDRNNIPDEYLCEVCKPRPVDRKKAKALQARRRTEIFKESSSSESDLERNKGGLRKKGSSRKKAALDLRKAALTKGSNRNLPGSKATRKINSKGKIGKAFRGEEKQRKQYRKRKHLEKDKKGMSGKQSALTNRRKSGEEASDDILDEDSDVSEFSKSDLEPKLDASQHLRSWIDQYEEAVTNHYSPELRARLTGNKLNGIVSDLRPSVIGAPVKCNVSLKGNGVKVKLS